MSPRDFDELVGEVEPGERERLQRTHELLVAAGPPPELPASLGVPPGTPPLAEVRMLRRRRLAAAAALAAALALAAFGAGFLVGDREEGFESVRTLSMRGNALAPDARASLRLGEKDESGNWPMLLRVRGLPELESPRGYYEMRLTRGGKAVAPCGSFRVHGGTTEVSLNAPYQLKRFDGWAVVVHERGHVEDPPVVMTT